MKRLKQLVGIALLPFLALVSLVAWMYASPVGASPDDTYHLISSYCVKPSLSDDWCRDGADSESRSVSKRLDRIACYAFKPEQSADCQADALASDEFVETRRGNFRGTYPPVFYAVMSVFAGDDILTAALLMRLLTIVLFLGTTIAVAALLPSRWRTPLLWAWTVTLVPLGMFLLSSNNPSAWALFGVVNSAFALLGWFDTPTAQRGRWIGLGALFALCVVIAAGARADAALYAGFAMVLVAILVFRPRREWWLRAILPAVMGLVALAFVLGSRQAGSLANGFSGGGGQTVGDVVLSPIAVLSYNILNLPFLWAGVFGTTGLGWLDTDMPWIVPLASIAAVVGVGYVGLGRKNWRIASVIGLTGLALIVLPLQTLQAGGDLVGQEVQPRYLFPLIVLLIGLLMVAPPGQAVRLTRIQAWVAAVALTVANAVAMQMNLRRYVVGIDASGLILEPEAEWWWAGVPFGPTAVWIIGSLAFGAFVCLMVPRLARGAFGRSVEAPV